MSNNSDTITDSNSVTIDVEDPNIKDVFANDVTVEIGESEMGLVFSYDFYVRGVKKTKPSVRIILTHDSFMRMVEFFEKRAKLLRTVYGSHTPNLLSGDQQVVAKAFEELYGLPNENSQEE